MCKGVSAWRDVGSSISPEYETACLNNHHRVQQLRLNSKNFWQKQLNSTPATRCHGCLKPLLPKALLGRHAVVGFACSAPELKAEAVAAYCEGGKGDKQR